jgi:hypothetical protein
MPRRKLIDIQAINMLRQQLAEDRAEFNRRIDARDAELASLLPPEDDREARALRSKRSYRGFLSE